MVLILQETEVGVGNIVVLRGEEKTGSGNVCMPTPYWLAKVT